MADVISMGGLLGMLTRHSSQNNGSGEITAEYGKAKVDDLLSESPEDLL